MVDLRTDFLGIKSPNPFWLASAPPTDRKTNVERAFRAGWGGVVWKTLGEAGPPIVNVSGARYGALHGPDRRLIAFNNIELITDRDLEINLAEIKEVKRAWPDRALVVSLMVPCDEHSWQKILARVEETECDGVELNFGCPHGMSERGMGSAVGQVPEYIEMVTRWCKAHTRMPVIVKLTPNITDIRRPANAAKEGGADAVSLINTINSIMGIDLDAMAIADAVDGKGTHGGMCGPAVKPIALSMVSEIARGHETRGLPISAIGGITTWRDAAEFIALGAGNVQVCTAAMTYGFKIVQEMVTGLAGFMEFEGLFFHRRFSRPRGSHCHGLAAPEPQLRRQGEDRSRPLHQMRALPHRLRGYFASGDLCDRERDAGVRRQRRGMHRLQSLCAGLPHRELHHARAQDRGRRSPHRPRLRPAPGELDGASEQSGRSQAGGTGEVERPPASRLRGLICARPLARPRGEELGRVLAQADRRGVPQIVSTQTDVGKVAIVERGQHGEVAARMGDARRPEAGLDDRGQGKLRHRRSTWPILCRAPSRQARNSPVQFAQTVLLHSQDRSRASWTRRITTLPRRRRAWVWSWRRSARANPARRFAARADLMQMRGGSRASARRPARSASGGDDLSRAGRRICARRSRLPGPDLHRQSLRPPGRSGRREHRALAGCAPGSRPSRT